MIRGEITLAQSVPAMCNNEDEKMKMNLYSSQREICLGQRFITKIFDRHSIHSHMYILTKVIKVKHFYVIL